MGVKKLVRKKFAALEEAHRQIEKANKAARKLGQRGHYAENVEEANKALRKAGGGLRVDQRSASKRIPQGEQNDDGN